MRMENSLTEIMRLYVVTTVSERKMLEEARLYADAPYVILNSSAAQGMRLREIVSNRTPDPRQIVRNTGLNVLGICCYALDTAVYVASLATLRSYTGSRVRSFKRKPYQEPQVFSS